MIANRGLRMLQIKGCGTNCKCADGMRRVLQKIPVNIIDETFINFQIKEKSKEYIKCYDTKNLNKSSVPLEGSITEGKF